jgi:dipeptidyl aminopeptidase/acylaminoacyl peptidase
MKMRMPLVALATVSALPFAYAQAQRQAAATPTASGYLLPPKVIVDMIDAAPTPGVVASPDHKTLALLERRSLPTIADLAQPIHRIAGQRINPKTNGRQQRTGGVYGITLKSIADGKETKVSVPRDARLGNVSFSPDAKRLAFTNTKENGIELWVADAATGQSKLASGTDRLNGTSADPCDWLEDNVTLLCQLVPAGRGPAPAEPLVPTGPNIQENHGKAAPAPTVQDLIKTAHDEDLFEYYFTSQLATFDSATGKKTLYGRPGILDNPQMSPNGEHVLVTKLKRPFSRLVPMGAFPADVEVWSYKGDTVKTLADVPSGEGVPINGVRTGPRGYRWRPDQPATMTWVEALDGGDIRTKAPFRDKVMSLQAPFKTQPIQIAKTEWRFGGLQYTERGVALLSEADRATRRNRTWILEENAEPRKLWERRQQDAYGNPGNPMRKRGGGGGGFGGGGGRGGFGEEAGAILQKGDFVYLTGQGASPEGDRPFLDRLDLKTLKTERLFRAAENTYETVIAPLDDEFKTLLTEYETPKDAPNYYVRDLAAGTRKAITQFKDTAPQLAGIEKQFVTYQRKDGVKLSGTLYLPPGYRKGQRLPVVMWAYPREFTDPADASQITGSPNRFLRVTGISHMFLLTQGYAIFDNPTMPIVGAGETANDNYVPQLVASAEAAVDKVVELGVAERDKIGVGGHSYGAFMTANLLAHSDLFRAGIARSGAYNRTLTPFGFQAERRTFWEVPEIYGRMSPFFHANKINEPILLIHGEADDNSGTFPIQSERLYMALKGHGATVRYVTLPYEAHGYTGRESVFHTLAEMINWLDRHVKNPEPKAPAASAQQAAAR